MKTKREVLAWAQEHGVEITQTKPCAMNPVNHVHADIVAPNKVFLAHGLHNLGLWDDYAAPDWKAVGQELVGAELGPCDIPNCEYCAEDE